MRQIRISRRSSATPRPLGVPAIITRATPSGVVQVVETKRTVVRSAGDPTVLVSQTEETAVNGRKTVTTFDAATRTFRSVTPEGRQWTQTVDEQGRLVQEQFGSFAPVVYTYDSRGRLDTVIVGTGPASRTTTLTYDALDRLSTVVDPAQRTNGFVFDNANRLVRRRFTDGGELGLEYDANGNLTSTTPPGRPPHVFSYNRVDMQSLYSPPSALGTGPTTSDYNFDRQPTVITRADGSTIILGYETPSGRPSALTYQAGPESSDGSITTTYLYSPTAGVPTALSASNGQTMSYGWDGSLLTSQTWSGAAAGSVGWTYDNDFRVASETVNGANAVGFGYDADGLMTSAGMMSIMRNPAHGFVDTTSVGNVSDGRTYNAFGELASYQAQYGGSSLFREDIIVRDNLGRIEEKTETVAGVTTQWLYSYNVAGRLWQVMKDGVLVSTYQYDPNGNRLAAPGLTSAPTYDAQDRLLTYGRWSYAYTPNSELQAKTDTSTGAVTSYQYDALGNLRRVDLPDGRVIEYVIDPLNRRVGKKVNGVLARKWLYSDQLQVVAEVDENGVMSRFVNGSYFTKNGSTYRLVRDHLGSVRLVVDANTGALAQRLDYDEYGRVLLDTNPGFQPLGFAGGLSDPDTGLVRFGARDYDPETGRWTAKDPIGFRGGDTNLYEYVMNDPINLVDPSGLEVWSGPIPPLFPPNGPPAALPDLPQPIVDAAAGFGDGVTSVPFTDLSLTDALRDALGLNDVVDRDSLSYAAGDAGGRVCQAITAGGAGAGAAGYRTRVGIHGPHHRFGPLGNRPHFQINWWKAGAKGSGGAWRFPLP